MRRLKDASEMHRCRLRTASHFLIGRNGTIFYYLHSSCYISLRKAMLLLYFRQMIFLSFSKHFNELSLTFLVILPLPIPEVFNCNSFNLNEFLLIQSGDVELNPSPKKSFSLTLFHWNLNGTATHDFEKVYLIQFYALPYSTDIIFNI